jgi:hypothetical protein
MLVLKNFERVFKSWRIIKPYCIQVVSDLPDHAMRKGNHTQ